MITLRRLTTALAAAALTAGALAAAPASATPADVDAAFNQVAVAKQQTAAAHETVAKLQHRAEVGEARVATLTKTVKDLYSSKRSQSRTHGPVVVSGHVYKSEKQIVHARTLLGHAQAYTGRANQRLDKSRAVLKVAQRKMKVAGANLDRVLELNPFEPIAMP